MIAKTRHIEDTLHLSNKLQNKEVNISEYLYIPTINSRCLKYDLSIKEGDHVYLGQRIGCRHSFFDQPIFSTCSGTFIGLEKHLYRTDKVIDFIKIHNDFLDTPDPSIKDRSEEEMANLKKADLIEIARDYSSVGLGGSSFPTFIKFDNNHEIKHILINGIECEPYLNTDYRFALEEADKVIKGTMLMQQCLGVKDARICFKSKHTEIIDFYEKEVLPRYPNSGISISKVGNEYPQGWEIAMIKSALGIVIPPGKLPMEYGVSNVNIATVAGLYVMAKHRLPILDRFISVQGDEIKNPSSFLARVGTPLRYLVEQSGGYVDDADKVYIVGGPMMGVSLSSDDLILTNTVTSVIVLKHRLYEEEPCIRCGSCVFSCPANLEPVLIMNAMKAMPVDKERVKALNPLRCIECGLCTYSCTSKIKVADYVKRAKVVAKLP